MQPRHLPHGPTARTKTRSRDDRRALQLGDDAREHVRSQVRSTECHAAPRSRRLFPLTTHLEHSER
jgi:hypothetical protein